MSLERYRNNDPRTTEELFRLLTTSFSTVADGQPAIAQGTANYAYLETLAAVIAANQEQTLQSLYDATFVQTATGKELTMNAREVGVERRPATRATGVVEFQRDSTASNDYVVPNGTTVSTGGVNPVTFETTERVILASGTSSVKAPVQATATGGQANVGANTVTTLVNGVDGIDSVTNPEVFGDPTLTDTNGTRLVQGSAREDDAALRKRAVEATSIGGAATAEATETALQNTDQVISATLNANPTDIAQNGLSPYSSEAIVYGGATIDIAETLAETMSVTDVLRLEGGVNGTKETASIYISLLDKTVTVPITRPTRVDINIDIDVVHTSSYAGTEATTEAAVEHIGGTVPDGGTTIGLGQGEDIVRDQLDNAIGDVPGTVATTVLTIDRTGDGTDDTTTDADGVEVVSIASNEVARVDAANITVNTTAR